MSSNGTGRDLVWRITSLLLPCERALLLISSTQRDGADRITYSRYYASQQEAAPVPPHGRLSMQMLEGQPDGRS